jgi:LmbE family N-acetylglucosaminyl deacetylase
MEGKNIFGREIKPDIIVDISAVMKIKEEMLLCHQSQREWLLKHHGMDEYLRSMKEYSAKRGADINKKYGEGFRQHLGHAFPTDNILKDMLSDFGYILSL